MAVITASRTLLRAGDDPLREGLAPGQVVRQVSGLTVPVHAALATISGCGPCAEGVQRSIDAIATCWPGAA